MDTNDQPAPPVWAPGPASPPAPEPTPASLGGPGARGVRRGLVSLAIVAGLLGVGGVAAVYAASPDPSSAPSTTAPSTTPAQPRTGTGKAPCDGDGHGGSSGGSTDGSNGSSGTNPTPTTAPAPTSNV